MPIDCDMDDIRFLARDLPHYELDEVRAIAKDLYGLEGDFTALGGERDLNYRVVTGERDYVLKIGNAGDDEAIADFQVAALRHVRARDPGLPVPEVIPDPHGNYFTRIEGRDGRANLVRLVSFLPGVPALEAGMALDTFHAVGGLLGRLNAALASFFHPAARSNEHPWEIASCLRLQPLVRHLGTREARDMVDRVFDRFRAVKPKLDATRHQVIHHDAHSGNVLVDPADRRRVTGLIDFGDMLYGPVVTDLAVAADTPPELTSQLVPVMAEVAAGFDAAFPLAEEEIDLVYDTVAARQALTATLTAARAALNPHEPAHLASEAPFLDAVEQLLTVGAAEATRVIRRACRFPVYCPASPGEAADDDVENELLAKRHRYMGRKATHFYRRPMHFERGRGVYLHATDGLRYLDCYNNVPQVGHCHPHVVRAIARQAAALNTNTRYLYSSVLEYAERLTAKLAPHLDACIFVNSGSEANDIAWQMAKIATGHTGGLLMEDAYHGITGPIREFSPAHPDTLLPPHLAGLLVPDPYRGPFRGGAPDIAERYAGDADRAIGELRRNGHEVAAFMIDSALCSSGVPAVPEGYVRAVEKRVRAAGGLMICDEVQSGFGRMGQWWGHELHGVTADIVTMGKPVGNGHPLGVVVTTQALLEQFIDKTGLFSTFGGNTVACAAGNAVLDVIEREGLIDRGREVGDYLRSGLRELAGTRALIGDVRGHGMLTGLEFVTDREARTPATRETLALLELMRERRVLVGKEGRDGNILKLRPALVFGREHADRFVDALDDALGELEAAA